MGHYDLYGNSYRTAQEALNAELAQCAEIDASIAMRNSEETLKRQQQAEFSLLQRIDFLEQRVDYLEKLLNADPK